MARLNSSIVLVAMLVVLGVGVRQGNGDLLDVLFGQAKGNQLADFLFTFPKWRIINKLNPNLSLTIRGGTVVLTQTNFNDPSQVWIQDNISIGKLGADDGCRKPFALVNFNFTNYSAQAIVPSSDRSLDPVKLAPYDPFQCVPLSMLWTKSAPVDDFSAIRLFRDEVRGFNAIGGIGIEGTVIGVAPTDGVNPNVQ